MQEICRLVGRQHNLTVDQMIGRDRTAPVRHARRNAMTIMRWEGYGLEQIGFFFDRRDHVTVYRQVQLAYAREGL